jgi:hypothetical protein
MSLGTKARNLIYGGQRITSKWKRKYAPFVPGTASSRKPQQHDTHIPYIEISMYPSSDTSMPSDKRSSL